MCEKNKTVVNFAKYQTIIKTVWYIFFYFVVYIFTMLQNVSTVLLNYYKCAENFTTFDAHERLSFWFMKPIYFTLNQFNSHCSKK